MAIPDFNPFEDFVFDDKVCFLSGEKLSYPQKHLVFPSWILDDYKLSGQSFKMLDEGHKLYDQVEVPCSDYVKSFWDALDKEVREASEGGYKAMQSLDQIKLFQWIGLWVYGVIFNEIQVGIRQQVLSGEALNFSQVLVKKFSNLHLMLKSLIFPVEFETLNPFSVRIFPVNNPADFFKYRDEINTLVFSLRMKDFGIIACLQDNGANFKYHEEVLSFIEGKTLHPIQFEEICARVFYSGYLFNRLPEYTVSPTEDVIYIEPMSLIGMDARPIFDYWQNKTYAQVLENFWKPWGYTLFEVLKDPENPMSFLKDASGNFLKEPNLALG